MSVHETVCNLFLFRHFSQHSAQRVPRQSLLLLQSQVPRQSLLLLQLLPLFLPNLLQELVSYLIRRHNRRMSQPTPPHCIQGRSENLVKAPVPKAVRPRPVRPRRSSHHPNPERVPSMVTRTITRVYLVTTNVSMHHFRNRALKYHTAARALRQTVCHLLVVTGSRL